MKKIFIDSFSYRLIAGIINVWGVSGLFVDGWAHRHLDSSLETFFTPWHAVLYSGVFALAFWFSLGTYLHYKRVGFNKTLFKSGYFLGFVGAWGFMLSGGIDFIWHGIFGIENNLEALLSPPHLLLATLANLVSVGIIKLSLPSSQPGKNLTKREYLPLLFGQLGILGFLTFFLQYAYFMYGQSTITFDNIVVRDRFTDYTALSGFVVSGIVIAGFIYYNLSRFKVPVGFFSLLFGLSTLMMFALNYKETSLYAETLSFALIGFVCADLIRYFWNVESSVWRQRFYTGVSVSLVFFMFMLGLILNHGLTWKVHMWFGVPIFCGILAFILGFLLVKKTKE